MFSISPSRNSIFVALLAIASFKLALAHGDDGGMDDDSMSMSMSMGSNDTMSDEHSPAMHMMLTAFSTNVGVANLWFNGWMPMSAGAMVGACIGLFFLAVFSRLLAVIRTSSELAWAQQIALNRSAIKFPEEQEDETESKIEPTSSNETMDEISAIPAVASASRRTRSASSRMTHAPPFTTSIDVPRAVMTGLQAFVGYMLMLAVMSYSAWYFIAILLGLMAGEFAFGRYGVGAGHIEGTHF